ncbi:MAG: hypothetical protein KDJ65_09785 [Anaerolineae bacterium]|nr:hypothetical protein [Anaerolineae bacterium]
MSNKLDQAVALIKAGNTSKAGPLLIEILQSEPSEEAWWWMSKIVPKEQKARCLKEVLTLNPSNKPASQALSELGEELNNQPQSLKTDKKNNLSSPSEKHSKNASIYTISDSSATEPDTSILQKPKRASHKKEIFKKKLVPLTRKLSKQEDVDLTVEDEPDIFGDPDIKKAIEELTYSKDIWDYIDEIEYLPNRKDRDQLLNRGDQKRVKIWDYFFRINPKDVGRPQQAEITLRTQDKQKIQNLYKMVENEKKKIFRRALFLIIGGLTFVGLCQGCTLLVVTPFASSEAATANLMTIMIGSLIVATVVILQPLFLITLILLGVYTYKIKSYTSKLREHREELGKVQASMSQERSEIPEIKPKTEMQVINQRIDFLKNQIEELQKLIPDFPDDYEVYSWLEEDFNELRKQSIVSTSLASRLTHIAFSTDDEEVEVSNPMVFISPGELQDPGRIPPPFRPVGSAIIDNQLSEAIKSKIDGNPYMSLQQVTNSLQPRSDSDRAKHLLARREISNDQNRYKILFGVYYIEYLLISDDMITIQGLFFDFITGRTTSDKITEQYYKDIVAIEQSKEFRTIPLGYSTNETLDIEDAPAFSLTLPSGEKRTVTFVNAAYLKGLGQTLGKMTVNKIHSIEETSDLAKLSAENAVKTLRHYLRLHKSDRVID